MGEQAIIHSFAHKHLTNGSIVHCEGTLELRHVAFVLFVAEKGRHDYPTELVDCYRNLQRYAIGAFTEL